MVSLGKEPRAIRRTAILEIDVKRVVEAEENRKYPRDHQGDYDDIQKVSRQPAPETRMVHVIGNSRPSSAFTDLTGW